MTQVSNSSGNTIMEAASSSTYLSILIPQGFIKPTQKIHHDRRLPGGMHQGERLRGYPTAVIGHHDQHGECLRGYPIAVIGHHDQNGECLRGYPIAVTGHHDLGSLQKN
jgi:hypothetical protein